MTTKICTDCGEEFPIDTIMCKNCEKYLLKKNKFIQTVIKKATFSNEYNNNQPSPEVIDVIIRQILYREYDVNNLKQDFGRENAIRFLVKVILHSRCIDNDPWDYAKKLVEMDSVTGLLYIVLDQYRGDWSTLNKANIGIWGLKLLAKKNVDISETFDSLLELMMITEDLPMGEDISSVLKEGSWNPSDELEKVVFHFYNRDYEEIKEISDEGIELITKLVQNGLERRINWGEWQWSFLNSFVLFSAKLEDKRFKPIMLQVLKQLSNEDYTMLENLGEIKTKFVEEIFWKLFEEPDYPLRTDIIFYLISIGGDRIINEFLDGKFASKYSEDEFAISEMMSDHIENCNAAYFKEKVLANIKSGTKEQKKSAVLFLTIKFDEIGADTSIIKAVAEDEHTQIRSKVFDLLKFFENDDKKPILVKLIDDEVSYIKQNAIRELRNIDLDEVYLRKKKLLEDEHWSVKTATMDSLKHLPSEDYLNDIIPMLKDKKSIVRQKAIQTLSITRNPEVSIYLLKMLNDEDSLVVQSAIVGLGRLRQQETYEMIIGYLDDNNEILSRASIMALGLFGDIKSVELLLPKLNTFIEKEKFLLIQSIIESLAQLSDKQTLPQLRELVTHNHKGIREYAKI